ncbi:extracellular solute-binding protein family 5 (plasmid) [Haloterrigena turkmenica DSM 5511]|uniref:Extracellular solute-binding protein family 5 n=1 Tax=Haloterrigena turkmenica (strain ATCC 51198 / DSM 5511 / JCM 9101 / NCIMB 13204 / VKM B-1734 / 4k) TaxID=543526 RepID=D2S1L2_HALTV|nr:ABC transporter substrate-binding protein [Haloterrigena turkmenica]ADB63259.1 extracellular solute-binding protein family 5 [Haloterrigena turkmenica DSM 5511]
MEDGNSCRNGDHSRRDVLKYGAVGGTALVAGCLGGGSSTDRFRVFDPQSSGTLPSERHCNPFNPTQRGTWHPGALIFDRPAIHSPAEDEVYPLVATDWEMVDDTTLEFTFSDEWTWHNGDQLVADDWVMQLQMALAILEHQAEDGDRPHQFIESAEAPDEQTVQISLHDPLSEAVAVQNAIADLVGDESRGIFTKHDDDQWSEWHSQLMEADDSEMESLLEELTSEGYPLLEDAIGNGPFEVADIGDNVMVFEKYEDHPNADNINFSEYSVHLYENNNPTQPYANGEVDAAHTQFPVEDDVKSQLPGGHTLIKESFSTNKLFSFNCGHDVSYDTYLSNANVRKAVCHVFDRQQVTEVLEGVNRMFDWPSCRVPGNVLDSGSHDAAEWIQDFTEYGQNDTERAAELLEREGFQRDDGAWYTPDGDRFEIDVLGGTKRKDFGVLKDNLNEFGIATNQEEVDDATLSERRQNGEFDIVPDGSSANGVRAMWALDLVPGWLSQITHFDPNAEIPMPVGDPEGSSGTKTFNVEEHIREWQVTDDDQYHKELMWWWNQTVPQMETMYQPDAGAYNADNWELDAPDGVIDGTEDALYLIPKMDEASMEYTG